MTQVQPTSERTSDEVPTWLTPGVRGIGLASFLADAGHEIPTSLFPSLLITMLGTSAAVLGLVEGLADGLAGLARLAGGPLADDVARRHRTAIGGYTSTAILSALIGAATAVWQVALLRMAAWASRGLRPAGSSQAQTSFPISIGSLLNGRRRRSCYCHVCSRCCVRRIHQRRRATNAHTPSTTPNGQVPASQPYREEAAQASAKISTHQAERCSRAEACSTMATTEEIA
jgi:hypothetical protein